MATQCDARKRGATMTKKLFICTSPRTYGKSAELTKLLAKREGEDTHAQEIKTFFLSEHFIEGCTACDQCKDDFSCIINDDMQLLYPLLDEADEIVIVSAVFFAGPPSQYKALLDRLQPYFWKHLNEQVRKKRPAKLFVIGEGGDPHGFSPLVISTRSALAVAGFSLDAVYDARTLSIEELSVFASHPELYQVEGEDFHSPHPPQIQVQKGRTLCQKSLSTRAQTSQKNHESAQQHQASKNSLHQQGDQDA